MSRAFKKGDLVYICRSGGNLHGVVKSDTHGICTNIFKILVEFMDGSVRTYTPFGRLLKGGDVCLFLEDGEQNKPFKVNDRVKWDNKHTKTLFGNVISTMDNKYVGFPVAVLFDNNVTRRFTNDGQFVVGGTYDLTHVKKESKEKEPEVKPFKKNDKVYRLRVGDVYGDECGEMICGEVTNTNHQGLFHTGKYPVLVKYYNGEFETFTTDGRFKELDDKPSLFHSEKKDVSITLEEALEKAETVKELIFINANEFDAEEFKKNGIKNMPSAQVIETKVNDTFTSIGIDLGIDTYDPNVVSIGRMSENSPEIVFANIISNNDSDRVVFSEPVKVDPSKKAFESAGYQIEGHRESLHYPNKKSKPSKLNSMHKDTEGKLFHELDFGFIRQMSERMASNKKNGKYEPYNWTKPTDLQGITDMKQAIFRHVLDIMDDVFEDDGREFGHLEALATDAMILTRMIREHKKVKINYADLLMK